MGIGFRDFTLTVSAVSRPTRSSYENGVEKESKSLICVRCFENRGFQFYFIYLGKTEEMIEAEVGRV